MDLGIRMEINHVPNEAREHLENDCLRRVNRFFELLGIQERWDDYTEYIDTHRYNRGRIDHYWGEGGFNSSVRFTFSNRKEYLFLPKYEKKSNEPNVIQTYHDQKYLIAQICIEYIKKSVIEMDKAEPVPHKGEQSKQTTASMIDIVNIFYKALGSDRKYNGDRLINWKLWNVYWSKPDWRVECYSNCSGSCSEDCEGGTCYYYFKTNEKNNPNLPDAEKSDPRNIYDDNLFALAHEFSHFLLTGWLPR